MGGIFIPRNILSYDNKQWYNFLLDRDFCKYTVSGSKQIICKAKKENPDFDWDNIWYAMRLPCLDGHASLIAFKIIHNLLPCKSRVASVFNTAPSHCKFSCSPTLPSDQHHVFFKCVHSSTIGDWLCKNDNMHRSYSYSNINLETKI